jgi:mannan endo-1,4-beta-mannosidase
VYFGGAAARGPEGTVKLYQMLHDYMVKEKKLTNLIWVWDIQDLKTWPTDAKAYKPRPRILGCSRP